MIEELLLQTLFTLVVFFYPVYLIYKRAGLNTNLSFTLFIPFVGYFVCLFILIFSNWNITNKKEGVE
ncbi:hypothetical protein CGJ91_24160 [Vibrio parahaemolyticus]|nr:hypothetical protein [Vibrio diabolicus]TOC10146.1 hypothetical protein CGJ91_24160 [Vibrio parahaemolyticus]